MARILDEDFIAMLEGHDLSVKNLMTGLFGGNRRAKGYGSSAEFAEYRAYVPGDDLRRVDWNLYARFGQLYLKLFADERQLHHRIYFDCSGSMAWGTPSKALTALRLGAALGFLSVQAMDRVSFFGLAGDACTDLCGTIIGRDAFYRAADALETLTFAGEVNMGRAVCASQDAGHAGGLSILISDFLSDGDWQTAADHLLLQKREVHFIRVLSRDEIAPDVRGRLLLRGAEGAGDEYRTEIGRAELDAYARAFRESEEALQSFCASRGIGLVSVCTDESLGRMLFDKASAAGLVV